MYSYPRLFFAALAASALILLASTSWPRVDESAPPASPAPPAHPPRPGSAPVFREGALKGGTGAGLRVSFDMSHAEIFSPLKEGPVDYSSFYDGLKKAGALVTLNTSRAEGVTLEGVDVYIVAGPSREFLEEEVKALKDFVAEGGSLLVLLHISGPVARLTETFGVIVSNHVISEETNTLGGSQDFYVTRFSRHPVTAGLKKIAVFGAWGLLAEGGAEIVAKTSERAWADMNRNRLHDEGEPRAGFGVLAVRKFGKGKAVVVSDDAVFSNSFITAADNRKLAGNILEWFKESGL